MVLTVGHGTLSAEGFASVILAARIELVVDIRRAPASRRHPQFGKEALSDSLAPCGIAYRWEERLGGWRKAVPDSPNSALRNSSFRGFADYMQTQGFWDGLDTVLHDASSRTTAMMCSESVYWRCHRRLIADALVIGDRADVAHLMHDGRLVPHALTDGVRSENGKPVYDGFSPSLPGL